MPATVGLIVLAQPTVALLLQRHAFTATDTTATAAALMFYAPGLVGYSAVKIASPTFYSLRDSRTPVVISVVAVLVNLATNLVLVRVVGYRGLALGTSVASMFNAGALLWMLDRRLGGIEAGRIGTALAKILCASTLMGIAAYATSTFIAGHSSATPGVAARALQVFGAVGSGLAVLAAAARLLRIAEFDEALRAVLVRLAPRS